LRSIREGFLEPGGNDRETLRDMLDRVARRQPDA